MSFDSEMLWAVFSAALQQPSSNFSVPYQPEAAAPRAAFIEIKRDERLI